MDRNWISWLPPQRIHVNVSPPARGAWIATSIVWMLGVGLARGSVVSREGGVDRNTFSGANVPWMTVIGSPPARGAWIATWSSARRRG